MNPLAQSFFVLDIDAKNWFQMWKISTVVYKLRHYLHALHNQKSNDTHCPIIGGEGITYIFLHSVPLRKEYYLDKEARMVLAFLISL